MIVPSVWLLASVRLWALLRVQTGWRTALGGVWELAALTLAVLLAAPLRSVRAGDPTAIDLSWWAVAAEAGLGTFLGLGLSLGGRALVGAAHWQAEVFAVPARAWRMLAAALAGVAAVASGLHHAALVGLAAVFERWPIGRPELWWTGELSLLELLESARALLVLGLALATPVLLVAATTQLALGSIAGRRGGAWIVEPLVLALRGVGGLVALAAAWSIEPGAWAAPMTRWIGDAE